MAKITLKGPGDLPGDELQVRVEAVERGGPGGLTAVTNTARKAAESESDDYRGQ
ncbi:MAG: hypothetical protein OEU49_05745 [Chromatiales bacterium]|nr:hypothetical protein [Chromatiales bacterium]